MESTAPEPVPRPHEGENPAPTQAPTSAPAATPSSNAPVAKPSAKQVHSLVIDANAIIKNDPSLSTLIAQAEELFTIPAVVSEIRDEATRTRFQTTWSPFLKLRNPRPESVKFVTDFARRTGDLQVLSRPDLHLLALTYDLEVERNGGDWRLRKEPGQKGLNGKPPGRTEEGGDKEQQPAEGAKGAEGQAPETTEDAAETAGETTEHVSASAQETAPAEEEAVSEQLKELDINSQLQSETQASAPQEEGEDEDEEEVEDDGEGEWITPSNIKKVQAKENALTSPQPIQRVLQAALITGDMAMRNVALRVNLNLLDKSMSRVTFLKTWVLRCHGCWKVCKDTTKQFCPSCGHATLTRVSCTTDAAGNFKLHLKKDFQYNKRGNVYSIPKPTHGSASGKASNVKGGGKNGWGKELILAEDQREYQKKVEEDRRTRYRDPMDDDYLPSILTGDRTPGHGQRIRVGAGRNVNAKKR